MDMLTKVIKVTTTIIKCRFHGMFANVARPLRLVTVAGQATRLHAVVLRDGYRQAHGRDLAIDDLDGANGASAIARHDQSTELLCGSRACGGTSSRRRSAIRSR
jgi:hypothetical protein